MSNLWKNPLFRNRSSVIRRVLCASLLSISLIGCGGGGGDDDGGGDGDTTIVGTGVLLRGTASTNRALASNSVEIKAQSGEVSSANIDANGQFLASNVAGDAPYLMRVDLGNDEHLYGVGYPNADGSVTQNVHSYSDVVVRNWFATQGMNIDTAFESAGAIPTLPTTAQNDAIAQRVLSIVEQVLAEYNLGGVDLLTEPYQTDNTGIDAYLNSNPVLINNGTITIIINDPSSNTQSVATTGIDLATDLAAADTQAPSTPMSVRVLPTGLAEIVIVWEPSSDNVGVKEYQVFRDGAIIGTTPFPVFSDTSVAADTAFSYAVVAVDNADNESSASMLATAQTSATADTTAPSAPIAVSTTSTNGSIEISWQQSDIGDVVGFNILRGEGTTIPTLISSVTATFVTDFEVSSGTEYCYQIVAVDASGNQSDPTALNCVSTTGIAVVTPPIDTTDPGTSTNGPTTNTGDVVISMTSATTQVLEDSGSVTITVNRQGNPADQVSVDYSFVNATAIEGEDYSAVDGTLTWASGDTSPKSIVVQIASDAADEAPETFEVMLTNVSQNASVGAVSSTTVTITNVVAAECNTVLEDTNVTENTTLSFPCYLVPTDLNVRNPANLTIAPGVTLKFASGKQLYVEEGASLTAKGTAESPILLTGQETETGFWSGVEYYFTNSSKNILEHVTIEYAGDTQNGNANLYVRASNSSPTRLKISNVTLRHSLEYGFSFDQGTNLTDFSFISVAANAAVGILSPETAGMLQATSTFIGNTLDVIEVRAGTINKTTTWANLDVPWLASDVNADAVWTVSAGNTVKFTSGSQVYVDTDGALNVTGSATSPVLFTGEVQVEGYWSGVEFYFTPSPLNSLEYLTIEYAGGAENGDANLFVRASGSSPTRLSANNVVLRHSAGYGFSFNNGIILSSFDAITSTANVSPGIASPETIASIGANGSFSGNMENMVSIMAGSINKSLTWPALDVPYLAGDLNINEPLTLSAGTTLIMDSASEVYVASDGALIAVGTAVAPITFTGAQSVPGYWHGLHFYFNPSVVNTLDHVIVDYAGGGGAPASSGGIEMRCSVGSPGRLSVANTQVNNSSGWGMYLDANGCELTLGDNVTFAGNASGEINLP